MKSKNCSHDIYPSDKFCEECGKPVEAENCECGYPKGEKAYCRHCGKEN